jgi:hypothetical protein
MSDAVASGPAGVGGGAGPAPFAPAPEPGPAVSAEFRRLCRENLISLIIVSCRDAGRDRAEAIAVSAFAAAHFDYHEVLVVAAAPGPDWIAAMRDLGADLPDLRVVIVDGRLGYEDLSILGLRHAIGDHVLCLYPGEIGTGDLARMVEALATGVPDVVKAVLPRGAIGWPDRMIAAVAVRIIGLVTGRRLMPFQIRAFAVSRTALSRLTAIGGAMKFFRLIDLSDQFREAAVEIARPPRRRLMQAVPGKLRLVAELMSVSADRLILTLALICFGLALASGLIIVAAVLVKLLMDQVAPGWTSLAVLFAGVFAANFAVLAAICLGLLQLLRQGRGDASDHFTTEIGGGDVFRRADKSNVERSAARPDPASRDGA